MELGGTRFAVLISSCDSYSDLWPIFFHFLFKQWPTVPPPIYLITNYAEYGDDRIKSLRIGDDRQWASNMAAALEKIDEEWILFLQEDFFMNQPVNERNLVEAIRQLNSVNARFLEVNLRGDQGDAPAGTWLREANKSNFKAGLNATLWKKDFLSQICAPGLNIWQSEVRLRDCLRRDEKGIYYLQSQAPHILSYTESVRGQFWKPMGVEFLAKQGIHPDFSRRPYPPQGQGMIDKLIRSYYKRKMRIMNARREKKNRENPGEKVAPLKLS